MFMVVVFDIANMISNFDYQNYLKDLSSLLKLWRSYFWMLSFYFETEMKIYIFNVIVPNFLEEYYQSTGDLSVNIHYSSTFSIDQIKFVRNILEFQNDKKAPSFLKLQGSNLGSEVQNPPYKAQNAAKVIGK